MAAPIGEDTLVVERAISFVNSEFGESLESLKTAKGLYEQIKATRDKLEKQVCQVTDCKGVMVTWLINMLNPS